MPICVSASYTYMYIYIYTQIVSYTVLIYMNQCSVFMCIGSPGNMIRWFRLTAMMRRLARFQVGYVLLRCGIVICGRMYPPSVYLHCNAFIALHFYALDLDFLQVSEKNRECRGGGVGKCSFLLYTLYIYIYIHVYSYWMIYIYIFVHPQVRVSCRERMCWNVHGGLRTYIYIYIFLFRVDIIRGYNGDLQAIHILYPLKSGCMFVIPHNIYVSIYLCLYLYIYIYAQEEMVAFVAQVTTPGSQGARPVLEAR